VKTIKNSLRRYFGLAGIKHPPEEGHLTINRQEVGYVIYRSPKRRRTLSLYVESTGKLRLLVPNRTTDNAIRRMLENRKPWIAQRLLELQSQDKPFSAPPQFCDGKMFPYLGQPYRLHISNNLALPQGCQAADGRLHVNVHNDAADAAQTIEDTRLEMLLWYKKKAKEVLQERTDYWSGKLGLKYRGLKIGSPLRLWGSCSARNDIRYNWRIIVADTDIIDYLVVHELCHIAHKDHSRHFWSLLATAIPDWRLRRKRLRCLDTAFVF